MTKAQELSSCRDGRPFGQSMRGPKSGAAVPLSVGGAGSPSNTVSPRPRPTSIPSGSLNNPAVWPQYANVTDRKKTDRTDNGPIA